MNIVISGLAFPVTAAFEYLVRGFRNIGHNVKVVGPFYGTFIPWTINGKAGVHLPDKYVFEPDVCLPENTPNAPIGFIEKRLNGFIPDLWLDVNAGFYLTGKPKHGIRATFLTDPHVLANLYHNIAHEYQYIFNPQLSYWLNKLNEHYLPYAADSIWHSPQAEDKQYDVTLLGNTYQHRIMLMNTLKTMGYRTCFELGKAKEDAQKIYNQSLIGLNWSTMLDINARVFELMGLGIVPLMNRVPYLSELFTEGVEYIGFDTQAEAIEQIKILLASPDSMAQISKNAQNAIIDRKHTWNDRAQKILEICGLTK